MAVFTENDLRLLDKTISIRERIIDNLLTKELPSSVRDIEAFSNLLESVDRSILDKAKVKIEDINSKINEETKDILRAILLDLHNSNGSSNPNTYERSAPEYKPNGVSLNTGELIIGLDNIDLRTVLET
jgi:hypothetical protein